VVKTDVLDARTPGVKRVVPHDEGGCMVENGTTAREFEHEERGAPGPEGMEPESFSTMQRARGRFKSDSLVPKKEPKNGMILSDNFLSFFGHFPYPPFSHQKARKACI